MRWINFSAPGAMNAYGILDGDRIREVRGTPFGEHELTDRQHRLQEVKIEVPFVPRTFYAARNSRARLRVYDLIVLAGYLIRWPLFGLLSLADRGTNSLQRSRDSRRHAWTALRLLLHFEKER